MKPSSRREELLDLAEELLEQVGIDGFGVGTLAAAATIKPPSLYKHFAGVGDIYQGLIARGFRRFGAAMAQAPAAPTRAAALTSFAAIYRAEALARPQLYLLMTARPLDRATLEPGAEEEAMAGLISIFGETQADHTLSRSAWSWAHGIASLEIAKRFPPDADIDAAWQVLVDTLSERLV
ncbi:TetR/AcrR family transcriptional regulator [Microbacterium sp. K41]|uniref:TetR/AcrR family transcriptional regulator n=1 Tax=Microbacterium sp. K41 TaxID=2305437 RepID=UPI0014440012|nr:TetR-like C-terminal domain-containing protein [Microbacterium sp. K41]